MFERFDDETGVAVEFLSDGEDGNFAVSQVEGVAEERARHHRRDGNEGVGDLF